MSVSASFVGTADGHIDSASEFWKTGEGEGAKFWKRAHWVVTLSQQVVGLTSFTPSEGSTTNSFTYAIGGGSTLTYSATGKSFHCTRDVLIPVDMTIGEFRNEQVWEWFGPDEEIDEDDFVSGG